MDRNNALLRIGLREAVLKSERTRALLLLLSFSLVLIAISIIMSLRLESFRQLGGEHIPFVIIGHQILSVLYALFLYLYINKLYKEKKAIKDSVRYISAFVEVSVPTFLIWMASLDMPSALALNTPPFMFYALFILVSALRMSWRISIFTGLFAGLQFIAIAVWFTWEPHQEGVHPFTNELLPYIIKGLFLIGGGIVVGLISKYLEDRFIDIYNSQEERNHVMSIFGQQVSPEVVNKLLEQKNLDSAELSNVCIMFLDIRDFTKFSETSTPEEVIDFLNHVFGFMIDQVNKFDGIINKFLGDGFMAVFGAPLENPSASINAFNASIEILNKLDEEIKGGKISKIRIGIGLHAGEAMTGNVGSAVRKEYTIIGDVVNTASRIEQLNKEYGTQLMLSEVVYEALSDEEQRSLESLGEMKLKGKEQVVKVFAPA